MLLAHQQRQQRTPSYDALKDSADGSTHNHAYREQSVLVDCAKEAKA
jgi:hypothetical protein